MPIAFPSGSTPPTPPALTLDAACRSLRGDLSRAARRTGTSFGAVSGPARPARTPRAPAGPPAAVRAVRVWLLGDARHLLGANRH